MKEMLLACAQATEDFGKRLDAVDTYAAESKKAILFTIETRLSKIEFVYTIKGIGLCPKSTLFVRLYPQKNRPLCLHLYEIVRHDDFRCTYFPMIESGERMNACFSVLAGMVEEYLPAVEALAMDAMAYDNALADKRQAVLRCANINESKVPTDPELVADFWATWEDFYESFVSLAYFTNYAGYTAFLQGDLAKAKKLYTKRLLKGNLLPYEERLLAFFDTPEAATFAPMPPECGGSVQAMSYANGKQEGKLLLVTALFCYLSALAAEWLIVGATYLILGKEAVYYPLDWVFLLILPLLSAVFGSVAWRRRFIPLVFRDEAEKMARIDRLANGKVVGGVATVLATVCTAAVLFFGFLFVAAAPRFYADRMTWDDAAKFPLLNPVTYAYEDIEQVYYIEGRINVYGELVDRGSYVLVFADGTAIDLDGSISVEGTEEQVLPLLDPYIEEIITYPTDVELAKQYDKSVDDFFGYNDVDW